MFPPGPPLKMIRDSSEEEESSLESHSGAGICFPLILVPGEGTVILSMADSFSRIDIVVVERAVNTHLLISTVALL
jgi:hypothetical protein